MHGVQGCTLLERFGSIFRQIVRLYCHRDVLDYGEPAQTGRGLTVIPDAAKKCGPKIIPDLAQEGQPRDTMINQSCTAFAHIAAQEVREIGFSLEFTLCDTHLGVSASGQPQPPPPNLLFTNSLAKKRSAQIRSFGSYRNRVRWIY
jgi:hypothetical protein